MIITNEVKTVIEKSAFLSLVTTGPDGVPHPIIAGKGEVVDDKIIFGIYKMEQTQKNLKTNRNAQVLGAVPPESKGKMPTGYRLTGAAEARDKQLVFTASKVEALI
jgi:hypothetical protein